MGGLYGGVFIYKNKIIPYRPHIAAQLHHRIPGKAMIIKAAMLGFRRFGVKGKVVDRGKDGH